MFVANDILNAFNVAKWNNVHSIIQLCVLILVAQRASAAN